MPYERPETNMRYLLQVLCRLNEASCHVAKVNNIKNFPASKCCAAMDDIELMKEIRGHICFLESPRNAHIMFAGPSQAVPLTNAGQPRWGPAIR